MPEPAEVSIITEVALTIATAGTPRQAELLDRVAGDRRGDQVRACLDLDQRHHAVDLDRADHPGKRLRAEKVSFVL